VYFARFANLDRLIALGNRCWFLLIRLAPETGLNPRPPDPQSVLAETYAPSGEAAQMREVFIADRALECGASSSASLVTDGNDIPPRLRHTGRLR